MSNPASERRRELQEHEVTLNGKRAIVCGILNDYATVAVLPGGERAEFAWSTVERVIEKNDGNFNS